MRQAQSHREHAVNAASVIAHISEQYSFRERSRGPASGARRESDAQIYGASTRTSVQVVRRTAITAVWEIIRHAAPANTLVWSDAEDSRHATQWPLGSTSRTYMWGRHDIVGIILRYTTDRSAKND